MIKCDGSPGAVTCTDVTDTAKPGFYFNAGGNLVISCTGEVADLTCSLKDDATGMYLNADVTSALEDALLSCTSGICEFIIGVDGDTYIDEAKAGNIITCYSTGTKCTSDLGSTLQGHAYLDKSDTSSKKIIICPKNGGACVSSDKTDTENYFINGSNPTELISCTSGGSCTSADKSAVTLELKSDGTQDGYTIACSSVLKGCVSSKIITQCSDVSSSCSDASGAIANDHHCIYETDGSIRMSGTGTCTAIGDSKFIFKDDGTKVELNGSYDGSVEEGLIYECASGKCTQIISSSLLVTGSGDTKYLYVCGIDKCEKVTESVEGHYLSGVSEVSATTPYHLYAALVKCNDEDIANCSTGTVANSYFIDSANPANIISCNGSSKCHSAPHGATDTSPKHYLDVTSKRVISCNSNGCSLVDESVKGYFLNSGTADKHVIQCNATPGNSCSEVTDASIGSSSTIGNVKLVGGVVYLCKLNDCSQPGHRIEIKMGSEDDAFEKLTIAATNDFPGITVTVPVDIYVKIGKDGSAIEVIEAKLPTCGGTCSPDVYCITPGRKVQTKSAQDTSCVDVTSDVVGLKYYFFDSEFKDVGTLSIGMDEMITAYQCEFVEGETPDLNSCTMVRGYLILNDFIIKCHGFEGYPCTVEAPATGKYIYKNVKLKKKKNKLKIIN